MCLDKLKTFKVPVYGYKVFRINIVDGSLYSVFQGKPKEYSINKILDEKCFRSDYNKYLKTLGIYPYGFHIYQSLKSAKIRCNYIRMGYSYYAIYKVEIIEPHTTGIESLNDTYCHVIVSKKMRIIEKIC